ncbi:MAG: hypothetical protein Q9208_006307 [Pyrenodesmia sp. 3 TL-2023]
MDSPYPLGRTHILTALSLIRSEAAIFRLQGGGAYSDGDFASAGLRPENFIPDLLRGLLWRGRQQENVFRCFLYLCKQGICDISSLGKPVHYGSNSALSGRARSALRCWPVFDELGETGVDVAGIQSDYTNWQTFYAPLVWLSVMVARSARSLADVVDAIAAGEKKVFGEMDGGRRERLTDFDQPWSPSPDDSVAEGQVGAPYFGMMLPEGVDLADPANTMEGVRERFVGRFKGVKYAYKTYFDYQQQQQS